MAQSNIIIFTYRNGNMRIMQHGVKIILNKAALELIVAIHTNELGKLIDKAFDK